MVVVEFYFLDTISTNLARAAWFIWGTRFAIHFVVEMVLN